MDAPTKGQILENCLNNKNFNQNQNNFQGNNSYMPDPNLLNYNSLAATNQYQGINYPYYNNNYQYQNQYQYQYQNGSLPLCYYPPMKIPMDYYINEKQGQKKSRMQNQNVNQNTNSNFNIQQGYQSQGNSNYFNSMAQNQNYLMQLQAYQNAQQNYMQGYHNNQN